MNETWIALNSADFQREKADSRLGNRVSYFFSPYNIPTAVKGCVSKDTHEAVIEFRYIDGDEPTIEEHASSGFVFSLGKNSKRVFQIKILDSIRKNHHQLVEEIRNNLKTLENDKPRSRDNYDVTGKVMASYDRELFAG